MAKNFVLNESDVTFLRKLKREWRGTQNRLPGPRRTRRFNRGSKNAKAQVAGALAIIKGTVPASSDIDVSGNLVISCDPPTGKKVVDSGILTADFTDTTFTAGALMVNPDGTAVVLGGGESAIGGGLGDHEPGGGLGEQGAPLSAEGDPPPPECKIVVADVLNPAYTDYIGEGLGVFVSGALVVERVDGATAGETIEKVTFILPWDDERAGPGYAVGSDPILDAQAKFHEGGARDFKLSRNDCVTL